MGKHQISRRAAGGGFTLVELLVVVGLIAVLLSLLMPALGRVRSAANATACLSNLRQMGTAWQMYIAENRGRLPDYVNSTPATPDVAWQSYWLGILDRYRVRGETLLCPAANEPIPYNQLRRGVGNAAYAWTGKYQTPGSPARLNAEIYRDSSYGYNRYLTAPGSDGGGGFGADGNATKLTAVRPLCNVPVFMDSVYLDTRPEPATINSMPEPPPNLQGNFQRFPLEHWKFLIARHGRGINVYMADGSARRIGLEDTYMLTWNGSWPRLRLQLPAY
jgi:prepilin-type N-terminal cleavage/methylation domain-containing protein/prepilin-type processing-associated H-X9-DG protein